MSPTRWSSALSKLQTQPWRPTLQLYLRTPRRQKSSLCSTASLGRVNRRLSLPCLPHSILAPPTVIHRTFSAMSQSQSWWDAPATPPPADGGAANVESEKMNPDSLPIDNEEELLTRRIHMLGQGSIGTLVTHSLALLPNRPPITLMFHRPEMYNDFRQGTRIVRLINKNTDINDEQTGFDVDLQERRPDGSSFWQHVPDEAVRGKFTNPRNEAEIMENGETFIYNLIVTVKGPNTVSALRSVRHRIDSRSTILLMQNGMGQIDELNTKVFTDPTTRPTYMLGIISHGCYMQGPFAVVHAGFGSVALGVNRDPDKFPFPPKGSTVDPNTLSEEERKIMYPTDSDLYGNLSSRYLLRTLTRSPVLACAAYPYLDLLQLQLEKLVSNAILNPLTALLDVENGRMLENQPLTRIQRLLIAEISLVIRGLPELEGIPNVRHRFSSSRLETFFRGICNRTAKNSSSMREDVRHVNHTEIDYINGYIVRRGEEQGIKCVLNFMIMQLIKGKTELNMSAGSQTIPRNLTQQKATQSGDKVVLQDTEGRQAEASEDPIAFVPFEK